ncbi:MAG: hypothetical protein GXY52_09200 [Chloroflexi bacterium]|nr:hypothetical protein [Chloroflexota bacterium]
MQPTPTTYPVLRTYEGAYLARVALPLGGIGTGTVSLGGRGQLQDWEIYDQPAKGFDGQSVVILYARPEGHPAVCRVLEGVLRPPYEGAMGARAPYHGLPRMRSCRYGTAYPFAQVDLADPDVPLEVSLQAFNPFIPADADRSGLPVACLRYILRNPGVRAVDATISFSLRNFIGNRDGAAKGHGNRNQWIRTGTLQGLCLTASELDPHDPCWGSLALATSHADVTYKLSWGQESWGWGGLLLHHWDDLLEDGRLDAQDSMGLNPIGSLAASCRLGPGELVEIPFYLAWHMPNRMTWTPLTPDKAPSEGCGCQSEDCVGNYYTTCFANAWDALVQTAEHASELEHKTLQFTTTFLASDLPETVKEAALFNLSTLRCQTSFRTADGTFCGWEGCGDNYGSCHGSCTHVWNYEQAIAFLFGSLSWSMRTVEFNDMLQPNGLMNFRVPLPRARAPRYLLAAADGQMGCLMKLYRDWQLSGDTSALQALWPAAKKALAFAWLPGGWDADQDGVMEGCQHNTLDVEYYGPNPLMAGWYLGALRAGAQIAEFLGDDDFAVHCRSLAEQGAAWVDANLFNGDYYEQHIQPPDSAEAILPGLRSDMGAVDLADPDYQLGAGCLVDQLVGQLLAHVCGLGYLLDEEHVKQTLQSIWRYNHHDNLYGHFNHLRTFALNDERAMLMVSYPRGRRPHTPVPYFNEVMTGFEYSAAVHMLYEGLTDQGLQAIADIRARYDGQRRNPYNEAECGHHYARAMCSWAAVLALSGFRYNAIDAEMRFGGHAGRHFWSTGYAWGSCLITKADDGRHTELQVLGGEVRIAQLVIGEHPHRLPEARVLREGDQLTV